MSNFLINSYRYPLPFTGWTPNVSGTTSSPDWDSTKARGFQVTAGNPLINNSLTSVAFKLWSTQGASPFDLYVKLYSSAGAIRETSTNYVNTASLSTSSSGEFETFTFDGSATINANDVIALWHGSNHLLHIYQYSYADTSDTTWTPVTIIPDSSPVTVTGYPETVVT